MDYTQSGDNQTLNGVNAGPNLNTMNQLRSREADILSEPIERNPQQIGNMTMNASENPEDSNILPQPQSPFMPPEQDDNTVSATQSSDVDQEYHYDASSIKMTGNKLNKAAVGVVKDAEKNLLDKGNVSGFYATARGMVGDNLKNSFSREIGK